ncbi:LysR family transcriptional regulator [Agrobacterium tumefaciens]|jgi:DNA-binding transcriptional LysR family regulator|uniref:LysR family transcriptional regulator n=1 Tax=Agrobacterium tumefaciens TaxID=358 RepID=UPI001CBBA0C3|nr:LysR family transcriptional regulator [Agrobacterium tumefaciens]MCP2138135.1 DNA-binding transcriptional LysR family regulator [Rhizobium sp. SLBN-94]
MDRLILRDLAVFETVARRGSFTDAASELGVKQSTLSYTISQLERKVGVPLLARTTRSVAPTSSGRRLLEILSPAMRDLREELVRLQEARETVAGVIRLTMIPAAFESFVRPALPSFCQRYPDVEIEISTNEGLNDIVAEGFDGGIRFGTLIDKDMVALPLTKSTPVVIAGSTSYFERYPIPLVPEDLAAHRIVSYRYKSSSRLLRWPLQKGRQKFEFKADPALIFDDGAAIRSAVIDGMGLGFLLRSQVLGDLKGGNLVDVLTEWLTDLPGFSLYYPSRRRTSPAFRALIEHFKEVGKVKSSEFLAPTARSFRDGEAL